MGKVLLQFAITIFVTPFSKHHIKLQNLSNIRIAFFMKAQIFHTRLESPKGEDKIVVKI